MNHSLDYAKQLNDYLLNLEVIKEYQKYEQLINQNTKIRKMEAKIKAYQKKIVNQKAKQDETVIKTIKEYQKIKEEFEKEVYRIEKLTRISNTAYKVKQLCEN